MFIGVPIKIGASGVEEIYDLQFNEEDKAAWEKSVESVKRIPNLQTIISREK